ncbi:MAG: chemotaxis protein CheW [Bacteroidota bacterium]|nr:chemotaxis protein CheW [Bacteroidota bacterium]
MENTIVFRKGDESLILKERAEALAKPLDDNIVKGDIEILKFTLSNEIYAFETKYVKEVLVLNELVQLPFTPDFVKGIISVRGEIISVLDIKKFFNLQSGGITDLNRVIILRLNEMTFGVLADRILDVDNISSNDLHTTLLNSNSILEEYIIGVTSDRNIVLNGFKFLTENKIIVSDEL